MKQFLNLAIFLMTTLLLSPVANAAQSGGSGNSLLSFLPLVGIFIVFYFLAIRPQQKKQKAHKKMIDEVKAGDEIVTSSGIYGKISKLQTNYIDCEIAKGIRVKVQKNAITQVIPKGTIENLK